MIGGPRGLLEQEALKPKSVSATLRRFGRYFAPYWLVLIVTLVLMIGNAWVQVITPELLGQAVDCYFTPGVANLAIDAAPAAADAATSAQPTAAQTNCWFDTLPSNAPTADLLRGLGRLSLVLVGLYIFGSISGGLMFFMMSWSGQKVLTALRGDLFDHLRLLGAVEHALDYFDIH